MDSKRGYLCAFGEGLFQTKNGGESWERNYNSKHIDPRSYEDLLSRYRIYSARKSINYSIDSIIWNEQLILSEIYYLLKVSENKILGTSSNGIVFLNNQ